MACNDLADNKFEGQNMLKTFFCNEHSLMLWNFCRYFVQDKLVWFSHLLLMYAKTPWSWGRMHDILSEGREIETCRQLEAILIEQIGNEKQARPRTTIDARAHSKNWTRSQARKV